MLLCLGVTALGSRASARPSSSLVGGTWICDLNGIPKSRNSPQFDEYRADGTIRWRAKTANGEPLSSAYFYKFDQPSLESVVPRSFWTSNPTLLSSAKSTSGRFFKKS
jgi:hypothetical protein